MTAIELHSRHATRRELTYALLLQTKHAHTRRYTLHVTYIELRSLHAADGELILTRVRGGELDSLHRHDVLRTLHTRCHYT